MAHAGGGRPGAIQHSGSSFPAWLIWPWPRLSHHSPSCSLQPAAAGGALPTQAYTDTALWGGQARALLHLPPQRPPNCSAVIRHPPHRTVGSLQGSQLHIRAHHQTRPEGKGWTHILIPPLHKIKSLGLEAQTSSGFYHTHHHYPRFQLPSTGHGPQTEKFQAHTTLNLTHILLREALCPGCPAQLRCLRHQSDCHGAALPVCIRPLFTL